LDKLRLFSEFICKKNIVARGKKQSSDRKKSCSESKTSEESAHRRGGYENNHRQIEGESSFHFRNQRALALGICGAYGGGNQERGDKCQPTSISKHEQGDNIKDVPNKEE